MNDTMKIQLNITTVEGGKFILIPYNAGTSVTVLNIATCTFGAAAGSKTAGVVHVSINGSIVATDYDVANPELWAWLQGVLDAKDAQIEPLARVAEAVRVLLQLEAGDGGRDGAHYSAVIEQMPKLIAQLDWSLLADRLRKTSSEQIASLRLATAVQTALEKSYLRAGKHEDVQIHPEVVAALRTAFEDYKKILPAGLK